MAKNKSPGKPRAWKPTAFNILSGNGHFTITLNDGRRTGPTLSWGGPNVWKCVQDKAFEDVLWKVANQKDEMIAVNTGPTKRVKLANGQYKYIPDMKKIGELYSKNFPVEADTKEDD